MMKQTSQSMDVSGAETFMSAEFQLRNIQPTEPISRSWPVSYTHLTLPTNREV